MGGTTGESNRRGNLQAFNVYKDQIFQKKKAKVEKLATDNAGKRYKKHLIKKIFEEDAKGNKKKIPKQERIALTEKL